VGSRRLRCVGDLATGGYVTGDDRVGQNVPIHGDVFGPYRLRIAAVLAGRVSRGAASRSWRLAVSLPVFDVGWFLCVRGRICVLLIQQAKNPRWAAASSGAHARNVPAVRSSSLNFWPRCSSPGCGRRVPPDALHDLCRRAGPYVALIRAPGHGGPCCPGACPGCRACLDTPRVQAGWCVRCGVCVGCCRGHGVLTGPALRRCV
jgi:hypothetical protein